MKAPAIALMVLWVIVTPSLASKVKVALCMPAPSIHSGTVNHIVISRDKALNG